MTQLHETKRAFGRLRRLPSGRWQAAYTGPDGRVHKAPQTFGAKLDAEAWMTDRRREIDREQWSPRVAAPRRSVTFAEFAAVWLARTEPDARPLKPKTVEHYAMLLDRHVLPTFGALPLSAITPGDVHAWHDPARWSRVMPKRAGRPKAPTPTLTLRAHAYGVLRTVLASAVVKGHIVGNPCTIPGAGTAKRVHKVRPASLPEVEALTAAMPERLRVLVLLSAWCGLRFGESTELRRHDVDLAEELLHVRRGVVRVAGEYVVGTPKSEAGVRDVSVPPHLLPMLTDHLARFVAPGRDALLFPAANDVGAHLAPASLYRAFYPARDAAGRPDLRWHDLRHTGAVLAASTGATLAELMARLGHSTPQAALRYQHAAAGRDRQIAAALSALVEVRP